MLCLLFFLSLSFYSVTVTTANAVDGNSKPFTKPGMAEQTINKPTSNFSQECLSMTKYRSFYYEDSCFVERSDKKPFKDAKISCMDMSPQYSKGHLAHVKDKKILGKIVKKFGLTNIDSYRTGLYIGLAQKQRNDEPAGSWHWINALGGYIEPLDEQSKGLWPTGEPDNKKWYQNAIHPEDCAVVYIEGFNDVLCDFSFKFICQYSQ